jgi:hypothetical protein
MVHLEYLHLILLGAVMGALMGLFIFWAAVLKILCHPSSLPPLTFLHLWKWM